MLALPDTRSNIPILMLTASSPSPSVLAALDSDLVMQVLQEVIKLGVSEFCLCAGSRNAPLVYPLLHAPYVHLYHWPEERSAAFFALGRMKATGRPVAILTTSGTAAGELLPAVMEAYYTGLPFILITADRPRRFRGTGAPQSAEQVNLFGCYASESQDLATGDSCDLTSWNRQGPLHLNVCLEEPDDRISQEIRLDRDLKPGFYSLLQPSNSNTSLKDYERFLEKVKHPLVILGALPVRERERENVLSFLLKLQAPIYAEGLSGLREEPLLSSLLIARGDRIWELSEENDYPIDGCLRLGGVPTLRLWRDLEEKKQTLPVCSISELPFSGLSRGGVIHTSLSSFCREAARFTPPFFYDYSAWKKADERSQQALEQLFEEEPRAETSLIHTLSCHLPRGAKVYLGNSLPIREWDLAAVRQGGAFKMAANRGVNGIDGQLSTFLGYSTREQDNWALLGDLTALYDLAAPWITPQLALPSCQVVIVNNGGAGIFKRMLGHPAFYHCHTLSFEPFARFWRWEYERWEEIPSSLPSSSAKLIELVPDPEATTRFWKKAKEK